MLITSCLLSSYHPSYSIPKLYSFNMKFVSWNMKHERNKCELYPQICFENEWLYSVIQWFENIFKLNKTNFNLNKAKSVKLDTEFWLTLAFGLCLSVIVIHCVQLDIIQFGMPKCTGILGRYCSLPWKQFSISLL